FQHGQFDADGNGYGTARTAFFREVTGLALPRPLWNRARAWEATVESACCWWPTTAFVMVSERPKVIHLERVRRRGPSSHRLHCRTGPALAWDGWALYRLHGVRVPAKLIEAPGTLSAQDRSS